MAVPTIATVNTAVQNLYNLFSTYKTKVGARAAVEKLNELYRFIQRAYRADLTLTVNDSTDANLTAFIGAAGELGVAYGAAVPAGTIFAVSGTGDTTDNALATAKGSAVANHDVFVVTSSSAVTYLGTTTTLALTSYEAEDFVSLGS